jgi:eukaryotic-like serine/threonine-protein kinase
MSGTVDLDSRIGPVVCERFAIRRLLASGGMAHIYEAEDLSTGQVGALKLLRRRCHTAREAIERLTREAAVAARISDRHIVQTLAAGKLGNGEPFIFMELLAGEPLDKVLERRGRLPIEEALEIALQATQGLCAAHAAEVLHRDIKPANLFLVAGLPPPGPLSAGPLSAGQGRLVKLLDFGVSKLPDQLALTREGSALGTFSYMPPEQMLSAKRVDARADLYSLGVVLYQCIAGRLPFIARSVPALMRAMEKNDYVPVSHLRLDAPAELDAIVARTVRADPDERFGSARELHVALARLAGKSLPLRMLSIGSAAPELPRALEAMALAPAIAGVPPKPMSVLSARPCTAVLVETIVPKTHRPG